MVINANYTYQGLGENAYFVWRSVQTPQRYYISNKMK